MSEYSELSASINDILRTHKQATGMVVAMGSTCSCGYWTGEERAGITRPAGIVDALDWHRAVLISDLLSAQLATIAKAVRELKGFKVHSGYKYVDGVLLSEVLQAIEEAGK